MALLPAGFVKSLIYQLSKSGKAIIGIVSPLVCFLCFVLISGCFEFELSQVNNLLILIFFLYSIIFVSITCEYTPQRILQKKKKKSECLVRICRITNGNSANGTAAYLITSVSSPKSTLYHNMTK